MPRRVAVTGLGVISALGGNSAEFWQALQAGQPGIRPLRAVDPALLRFPNAAEVPNYAPEQYFDEKELGLIDRFAQFGVIAAREAIASAGIEWTPQLRESTSIITGTCVGGQTTEDEGFVNLYRNNIPRVNPFTIPRTMGNAAASRISLETGVVGPTYTISTACSSSNHAIGQAFWMVRSGAAEMAITGGSEAFFSLGFLKAWEAMRVVSPDTCRPFSKDRRGLILGEGAAMLVLEPLDAARARGAAILGEIIGFGMSSDAFHITQPSADGAARAMRAALSDAGVEPARHRLHQRARHRDAGQRRRRDRRHSQGVRRACGSARRQFHQVHARPYARRGWRDRGRRNVARVARRHLAPHRQLQRARPGLRPGCDPQRRPRRPQSSLRFRIRSRSAA